MYSVGGMHVGTPRHMRADESWAWARGAPHRPSSGSRSMVHRRTPRHHTCGRCSRHEGAARWGAWSATPIGSMLLTAKRATCSPSPGQLQPLSVQWPCGMRRQRQRRSQQRRQRPSRRRRCCQLGWPRCVRRQRGWPPRSLEAAMVVAAAPAAWQPLAKAVAVAAASPVSHRLWLRRTRSSCCVNGPRSTQRTHTR